jgi:hypothetical protein
MSGGAGKASNRPRFSRVLGRAATNMVNLGVAGTAAVAAAALLSWPIAAIGGAAYVALVAWDVANPDFWRKTFGKGAPLTARLPEPKKIEDPALRRSVQAIFDARRNLAEVLRDTADEVRDHLAVAIARVAELEGRAATLVTRGDTLARYLAGVDVAPVRAEIQQLEVRALNARDEDTRQQFTDARRAREEQLKTLEDIAEARDKIAAQLARIVATLDGLPAKVVRMKAMDAEAMDDLSGTVNEELNKMNDELKLFEETLRSLAEVPV